MGVVELVPPAEPVLATAGQLRLLPVEPRPPRALSPLFRWPGGKRWLLPRLRELVPADVGRYYEPFFGGGALFLALRPTAATISDRNSALMDCYKAIRDDHAHVARILRGLPRDRDSYLKIRSNQPTGDIVFEAGQSVTLGTAVSVSGVYGSFSVGGTMTDATNTGDDPGLNTYYRDYRMVMRYGAYRNSCSGSRTTENPMYESGGYSTTYLSGSNFPYSWTDCAPAVGTWYRSNSSGSAYSLSGGVLLFSLIGLNLSSTTTYSTNRVIKYYYNGNYTVCGNNDAPSRAAKIRSGA